MACGKPGGNPEAIARAADAIDRYANGVEDIFQSLDQSRSRGLTGVDSVDFSLSGTGAVDLSAFWRGDAARSSTTVISQYRVQLDNYSCQLRDYAGSLRDYAYKLHKAQQCTISQIINWVFMIVITICEIVIGFAVGGIIEGMFTMLFAGITEGILDTLSTIGMVMGDIVEFIMPFSRIVTNVVETGTEMAESFGDLAGLGAEEGAESIGMVELGGELGEIGADIGGLDVAGDALTSAAIEAGWEGGFGGGLEGGADAFGGLSASFTTELAELGTQVSSKLISFLEEAPYTIVDQSTLFVYKAIYNTAEWYFQELVIRGIDSLDPDSGGFAAQWNADDEKAEALSILAGMAVGSAGYFVTKTFLAGIDKVLINIGFDFSAALNGVVKAVRSPSIEGDLGETAVKLSPAVESRLDASLASSWLKKFGTDVDEAALDVTGLERSAEASISDAELASIRSSGKLDDLGTILKDEGATEVIKDMFNDTIENIWDYGSILALYPKIRGEDFDWKELWWYVTYGIVEGLIHAPLKHKAGAITNEYVGELFPNGASTIEKEHPVLSEAAKNLGDFLIADGLSMLRKVTLDPLADIGSYSEYLERQHEIEDTDLVLSTGAPVS